MNEKEYEVIDNGSYETVFSSTIEEFDNFKDFLFGRIFGGYSVPDPFGEFIDIKLDNGLVFRMFDNEFHSPQFYVYNNLSTANMMLDFKNLSVVSNNRELHAAIKDTYIKNSGNI